MPIYEPHKWNTDPYIYKSHNCYTYALNILNKKVINSCKHHLFHRHNIHRHTKKHLKKCPRPLPMSDNEIKTENKKYFKCSQILKHLETKFNVLKLEEQKHDEPCPSDYYKIALFLVYSEKDYKYFNDFHFYIQDDDGTWSHKDGWRKVTNKDYHGKRIINPELCAKRTHNNIFCGYYCVPDNLNIVYNNKKIKTYYYEPI